METNKHVVNYSEIQVGDLVQIAFDGDLNDTCLGYVTKVYDNKLVAIWSDDFEEYKEYFSKGNIIGHWKVVDFRKVPTKPYKQLVAYYNRNEERTIWGIYTKTENGKVYAHWNIGYQYHTGDIHMPADRITNVEDILIHEEKSKDFTFSDFDASVKRTWKDQDFKDAVSNAALGLTGEAGEVADLIKKAIYHGRNFKAFEGHTPLGSEDPEKRIDPEDVKDELSDVLYYVSATAQEFGFTLEDVAKHNKEKLEKRFPEGFSTEASAQKADKRVPVTFSKPYNTELPKEYPYFAKVIGDSMPNPTGYRHGHSEGTIIEVFSEDTTLSVKGRSVNASYSGKLTFNKVDLAYIPKPEEATTLKISETPFPNQQRLDVSSWFTWIPEGENWLEKIKELRVGETFESIDCHDTRHTFTKQPYGLVTLEHQDYTTNECTSFGDNEPVILENIKVIEEVQK
ncbi:nucleoside triphosphate pyrophosphohydrolase family protein [Bacillus wiedmannii]|uniref:nucleoside triphosphate pyrophosphohydrolase family protein n=1 Tax=Bacillus wiedmannii TaxID=1890302 RepID=UPI0015E1950C|nr:nucleoside triphosphate pyrophosphohydrolase family protein [Bacillus wiedmannii]